MYGQRVMKACTMLNCGALFYSKKYSGKFLDLDARKLIVPSDIPVILLASVKEL